MKADLSHQVVAVIGGTSGMGLAIARLCVSCGARVIGGSRSADKVESIARELGGSGAAIDLGDEASVERFFADAGELDHLVVSGSSVRTGTFKDSPLADGEFTFRSKFFGPYLCAKYATIKPTGSITFFSGNLSRRPGKNDAVLAGVFRQLAELEAMHSERSMNEAGNNELWGRADGLRSH